ncbi:adenosylcobalamin-dependent ribonucleoside-diphosphate reductase [Candidatus Uhrbacteria bacterium]|nr:adenosylcobalamin-dependent ribonucleoside-diphosphate reductase [Candidatus Uhrbacteria bacterium]
MHILEGLSKKVFDDRYALKDANGNQVESAPEEMWRRVAKAIAQVESTPEKKDFWANEFYKALEGFQFVPGGRILSGAGSGYEVTFYNCFVIPSPEDSRSGILDSVKTMVEIMSRSGGVGVNLSSLRPRGSRVKGVNGSASGAVSFGGLYSYATGLIIQGGSRRGALMLMLNDDHPDIEEFITVKKTMGLITNANLSVCVSDRFMEAVKKDASWNLVWKGEIVKTIRARYLWDLICESAWASGEPGTVFLERYNKWSNTWYFEDIVSVNPCGEQGLGPWSVCNLGALNLSAFEANGDVDWARLGRVVSASVRFLDNVIDATAYPFLENREAQKNIRRTGLGSMGLGDLLIKLKIRYGSPEAIAFCEKLYSFIRDEAYRASVAMAAEKGAFPKFEREKYLQGYFIEQLPDDIKAGIAEVGIRNAVLLTQAPTGTTSLLSGASSGIEPIYDFVFTRKDRIGEHEVYHPLYQKYIDEHPGEKVPDYFVNAKELSPEEHIRMQAIIQKYVDSSISKTVNAPEGHTLEDVKTLYTLAYELGCKGVAYFRENSRDAAVLYSKDKNQKVNNEEKQSELSTSDNPASAGQLPKLSPRIRPKVMSGKTYKCSTGYGNLYITVNDDEDGKPFEVFATIGKAGGFFAAKSESVCRLVSLSLRSGIAPEEVIDQIKGIRGPMPSWSERGMILSVPDAIAQVLEEHVKGPQRHLPLAEAKKEMENAEVKSLRVPEAIPVSAVESEPVPLIKTKSIANFGGAPQCPDCGGVLRMGEGCMLCQGCGYSKCG